MARTFHAAKVAGFLAGLFLVVMHGPVAAASASPDDTARVLAGMPLAAGSPLSAFTEDRSWQRHAQHFDKAWARLDKRQLSKIRTWSEEHLTHRQPVLYYMFSGPDFLYANAFFPDAKTYVMSGLEPVGTVPDLQGLSRGRLAQELGELQRSVNTVMSYSFFITKKMKTQLRGGRVTGTLPILYLFLARSGKTILDVNLVRLAADGHLHPSSEKIEGHADDGVKIVFSGKDGLEQTLYYFQTDLSNGGAKRGGFFKFCETLGRGDSLLKSASYLMHSDYFSTVRNFVLEHSAAVVQDDSGIPLRHFKDEAWTFHAFGNYLGPISIFPGRYQRALNALYRRNRAGPLDFGIGYRWRPRQSNLLLAVRTAKKTAQGE